MSRVTRKVSFPPSGSPAYSPTDLPVYRGGASGGGSPPPSCSVTLSGAIGPAFGFAAADVSGQTFSITSASAGVYLASSPFATAGERRSMPASGKKVWMQTDSYSASGGTGLNVRAGYIVFNGAGSVLGYMTANGSASPSGVARAIGFYTAAGALIGGFVLPQGDVTYLSLGMDSSGEGYFYRADTGTIVLCSDIDPSVAGAFSGASTMALFGLCDASGGGPASCSASFTTSQGSMADAAALTGDEDWCGNTI